MLVSDCATGTLSPYTGTWGKSQVMHLYRRMGYGLKPGDVAAALAETPSALVDKLIDEALAKPLSPEPAWAFWTVDDYTDIAMERQQQIIEWVLQWLQDMFHNGFRDKLSLFWHDHFATQLDVYLCPSYMYQYHKLLQQYALGNFKEFVSEMGKTPAMLVFLNGLQNNKFSPNENYARELFELFTMGADNGYTQQDIVETARALTGWNGYSVGCGPITFLPIGHDDGAKTIFGKTGNWGYDDVHDLIFTERAQETAEYICGKIYREFVHPDGNPAMEAGLAQTFVAHNFDLAPVFRQLFKSEHFFDPYILGTQIKSPVDFFLSYFRQGDFPYSGQDLEQFVAFYIFASGQELFQPPDVAGWPGNRTWIDSTALTGRWQYAELYNGFLFQNFPEKLRTLAKEVSGNVNDPFVVAQTVIDHFLPNGLDNTMAYETATDIFKEPVPQNYYDNGSWDLDWDTAPFQVMNLLNFLVRQPEFQLQ